MNPYTKLSMHLERHMYKRGQFKGDAPADSSRRGKNHFRVMRGYAGQMIVRMWSTDIITVTPDNQITINMRHWWTSTTKSNLNEALSTFMGWGWVGSVTKFSYTQLAFVANGKTYRYYDGMTFDGDGNPTCHLKPFSRQITDRDSTKEFRADVEASGFKAVFPILFAAAEPQRHWGMHARQVAKIMTNDYHANDWPELVAHSKYMCDDHKEAYRRLVGICTASMKDIIDTDVTVI